MKQLSTRFKVSVSSVHCSLMREGVMRKSEPANKTSAATRDGIIAMYVQTYRSIGAIAESFHVCFKTAWVIVMAAAENDAGVKRAVVRRKLPRWNEDVNVNEDGIPLDIVSMYEHGHLTILD